MRALPPAAEQLLDGIACGRETTAPRRRAEFHASVANPKRSWHSVML
jgi:hypothetical protein